MSQRSGPTEREAQERERRKESGRAAESREASRDVTTAAGGAARGAPQPTPDHRVVKFAVTSFWHNTIPYKVRCPSSFLLQVCVSGC